MQVDRLYTCGSLERFLNFISILEPQNLIFFHSSGSEKVNGTLMQI